MDELKNNSEGIIALSACLAGDISQAIMDRNYEKAKLLATEYRNVFGRENYFLEIQDHNLPEQKEVNAGIYCFLRRHISECPLWKTECRCL